MTTDTDPKQDPTDPRNDNDENDNPAISEETWDEARSLACRLRQKKESTNQGEQDSERTLLMMALIVGANANRPEASEQFTNLHRAEMTEHYAQALEEGLMRGYDPREYAHDLLALAALLAGTDVNGIRPTGSHSFEHSFRTLASGDETAPKTRLRITVSNPQGADVPLQHWQWAFGYFSQEEDLQSLAENSMSDYYHDTDRALGITGTEIVIDDDSLQPAAEAPCLTGRGYIFHSSENLRGHLVNHTDDVLCTVDLKIEVLNPEEVRTELRQCV